MQQRKWLMAIEKRLDATKRGLDSLKAIKMQGGEAKFSRVVNKLRVLEIRTARPFRALIIVAVLMCESSPTMTHVSSMRRN